MRIVIWGSSGQAKCTVDITEKLGEHEIAFLYDPYAPDHDVYGYPAFGREHGFADLVALHEVEGFIVGVGDGWIRGKETAWIKQACPSLRPVNAIHPFTSIGRDTNIGCGVVVMAGVVINSSTAIGDGCFLATNSSIDHDSEMKPFSGISVNASLGGHCVVGEYSFVALGANVINKVRIGAHSVIGAGALVLRDVPDRVLAYGSPCRVIRPREPGEPFL